MKVRRFQPTDSAELAKLFFDTIHAVNSKDYNQLQLNAWAPENRDLRQWQKSFNNKHAYVIEVDSIIAGFGEIEDDGHIDRFYISSKFIAKGLGRILYKELEIYGKSKRMDYLYVEASITAQPFFKKMGFETIKQQVVTLRGVEFINYSMKKDLIS